MSSNRELELLRQCIRREEKVARARDPAGGPAQDHMPSLPPSPLANTMRHRARPTDTLHFSAALKQGLPGIGGPHSLEASHRSPPKENTRDPVALATRHTLPSADALERRRAERAQSAARPSMRKAPALDPSSLVQSFAGRMASPAGRSPHSYYSNRDAGSMPQVSPNRSDRPQSAASPGPSSPGPSPQRVQCAKQIVEVEAAIRQEQARQQELRRNMGVMARAKALAHDGSPTRDYIPVA